MLKIKSHWGGHLVYQVHTKTTLCRKENHQRIIHIISNLIHQKNNSAKFVFIWPSSYRDEDIAEKMSSWPEIATRQLYYTYLI